MKRIAWLGLLALMLFGGFATSAQEDRLTVAVSFSILSDVVQNVTLDAADVITLIPLGADPHSYEPSARDLTALANADVIFVAGGGFEEQLLDAIANVASNVTVVEVSACVRIRYFGEPDGLQDEEVTDQDDRIESPYGLNLEALCAAYDARIAEVDAMKEAMGFPSGRAQSSRDNRRLFESPCTYQVRNSVQDADAVHDHGACDPHVWSDPRSVYYWTLYISDVLGELDPANAEQYAANAEEYVYAIDDLLRFQLEPELAEIPPENRVLLTNHETLGYFVAAYGFETLGFVMPGGSAMAEPSAQDLAALINLTRESGVRVIFAENTLTSRVAEQVAAESGASIVRLYTDSLSDADGQASTYLDYITYNFSTIAAALAP